MKSPVFKILKSTCLYLLKAAWQLLLLGTYLLARTTQTLAGFIGNLTEKMMK